MRFGDFIDMMQTNKTPVFTVKDAAKVLGKGVAYTSKFLSNKQGIEKLEKGRYCLSGTSNDVVASHMVYPSYLSLISALRIYNLTTQIPAEKYIITTVRHKPLAFRGEKITFIRVNKKLMFGFDDFNGAIVARPEKVFIDALYLKKAMWYTEEFKAGIEKGIIKIDRLKEYALAIGNARLIARLASFLEQSYSIDCIDLHSYIAAHNPMLKKRPNERQRVKA